MNKIKADKKVSVVVPVFNTDANYLELCFKSLLEQTYDNYEIIIIDDGSGAATGAYCRDLERANKQVRYIRQENAGVSAARNKGVEVAVGEYITFVDSDDTITKEYLELLIRLLTDSNADVSVAQQSILTSFSKDVSIPEVITGADASLRLLYSEGIPTGPFAKLFRRNLLIKDSFNLQLSIAEDLEMNYRLLRNAKVVAITTRVIYIYRLSDGSAMRSEFRPSRMDGLDATLMILERALGVGDEELIAAANYRVFMEATFIAANINDRRTHKKFYVKCLDEMRTYRVSVLLNRRALRYNRLIAFASLISLRLAVNLHVFRLLVARKLRG